MEGLNKSIEKNKEGYYEKGTLSQEDFDKLVMQCRDFIHDKVIRTGDQDIDQVLFVNQDEKGNSHVKYQDGKGKHFRGEFKDFRDSSGLDVEIYNIHVNNETKELFKNFTLAREDYQKNPVHVKVSHTLEELKKIFEDIEGYFEKK